MKLLILIFSLLLSPLYPRALDNSGMVPLLIVGGGSFDTLHDHTSPQLQLEYRSTLSIAKARPFIGALTTSPTNYYFYAGIGWDLHFSSKIVLTPSFAPGYYIQGSGKDLGHPIEFRSAIELAYKFENKARLGLQFYHLSNASLGEKNPGEESLVLTYGFPL